MTDKNEKKTVKKMNITIGKKGRFDPSKYINVEPTIKEAKSSTIVVSFGRMNPVTSGHEKLVNVVISEAAKKKADAAIYLSHTQDKKKNPLSYQDKLSFATTAFGSVIRRSSAKNIIEAVKELNTQYDNLILVVGSDRMQEFSDLLNKYNGKEFNFDTIDVVSAGERDPDAEDVSGVSSSKMRSFAAEGNEKEFTAGLPKKLKASSSIICSAVKKGMGMNEDLNELYYLQPDGMWKNNGDGRSKGLTKAEIIDMGKEDMIEEAIDESLSVQQRRRRGIILKRLQPRMKIARQKAKRRMASKEKLLSRSRKKALAVIRHRLSKKPYSEMSPAEKIALDARLAKISPSTLDRIAKKLLPKVRQAERDRLSNVLNPTDTKNENFEAFIGDLETINEASERDTQPHKRFHMGHDKNGGVKFDKRFKFFRKSVNESSEFISEQIINLKDMTENFAMSEKLNAESCINEKNIGVNAAKAQLQITREKISDKEKHDRLMANAIERDKSVKEDTTTVKPFISFKTKSYAPIVPKTVKHELGINVPMKHMIGAAIKAVDLDNDGDVDKFDKTTPDEITGNEKKDMTKLMQKKMTGEVKHTKRGLAFEAVDKSNPKNREYDTDSLVKILKGDTPGQEVKESALNTDIEKGARVSFIYKTLTDGPQNIEGNVVGTETYLHQGSSDVVSSKGRLRVRDDAGRLYIVKHEDINLLEGRK